MVHAHGAIWKERGLLTSQKKEIKHATEIMQLLEAVLKPSKGAIMHCKGQSQGNTIPELGNAMADKTAKAVAGGDQIQALALIPSNILTGEKHPPYDTDDLNWIQ